MQQIFAVAEQHLGLKEWPGAKHNPEIVKMFAASGHAWVRDDETPWCAAFVGAVLGQAGLRGTGELNAKSYLDWGVEVPLSEARRGDIAVLYRGDRDGPFGHVAIVDKRLANGRIDLLGGNQGDAVSIQDYDENRVLSIRRAKAARRSQIKSTTQLAASGAHVGNAMTALGVIPKLDGNAQIFAIAGCLVIAALLFWIMRERNRKWKAGDR